MSVVSLFLAIIVGVSLWFPLRYGAEPERWAAIVYGGWVLSSPLFALFGTVQFEQFDVINGGTDLALCGALIYLALKANRLWPLFAAAFSCVPIVGHLIAFFGFAGMQRAYWVMTEIPNTLVIIPILIGALMQYRRAIKGYSRKPWTAS